MTINKKAYVAGLLVANAAPHLATAVTGHRHLTPLAGRESGPGVNAVWGSLNLLGGLALLGSSPRHSRRWGRPLVSFEAGYLTFATWMAVTERLFPVNWSDRPA